MNQSQPIALAELAPLALLYHENSKITQASLTYLAESIGEFTADIDELRRRFPRVAERPFDSAWRFARVSCTSLS